MGYVSVSIKFFNLENFLNYGMSHKKIVIHQILLIDVTYVLMCISCTSLQCELQICMCNDTLGQIDFGCFSNTYVCFAVIQVIYQVCKSRFQQYLDSGMEWTVD